jgi:hypothetical protein
MSAQNVFKPMDLVQNPSGEIFFVSDKKPDDSSLYWAISLSQPEMGMLDVSDRSDRRLCSIEELPTAVRAVLGFREAFARGSKGQIGGFESKLIQVIDELQAILDTDRENR